MPGYSLVPVDYQPDLDDYSLGPVDYDPLAADGLAQQAEFQQPPNPTSDQVGASEPLPFSGFANPTPAESLVNRQRMKDQMELAGADRTGNNDAISDGEKHTDS